MWRLVEIKTLEFFLICVLVDLSAGKMENRDNWDRKFDSCIDLVHDMMHCAMLQFIYKLFIPKNVNKADSFSKCQRTSYFYQQYIPFAVRCSREHKLPWTIPTPSELYCNISFKAKRLEKKIHYKSLVMKSNKIYEDFGLLKIKS